MAVKGDNTGGLFPRGKKKKVLVESDDHAAKKRKASKSDDLFATPATASGSRKRKSEDKARAAAGNNKKARNRSKAKANDGGDEEFAGLKVVSAEPLSYGQLTEGLVVLGCVSHVAEYDLKVSLPGRLVGRLPITAVSRPYTKALEAHARGEGEAPALGSLFTLGQPLICAVTKIEKGNNEGFFKVTLSCTPQSVQTGLPPGAVKKGTVLQSAVVSAEDHGYIMDIGIAGVTAFLPKKKTEAYCTRYLEGRDLAVGQVLPTLVTKGCESGSMAVSLTSEPVKMKKSIIEANELSTHMMLPGMVFRTQVEKVIKKGVRVSLGGSLKGYVNRDHLNADPSQLEEGSALTLRLLYVIPALNILYLSQKSHLSFGENIEDPFLTIKVGSTVKKAEVLRVDEQGLIIQLNDTERGFVSPRQVSEEGLKAKELKSKFSVGSHVSCRIIHFDYCEQIFICSMQKSQLMQKQLQWDQLKPGEKVTCKVKHYTEKGAIVTVGKMMDGFIPMLHLSDVPMKNPEKKYPPGSKLHCRVLKVTPARRQLHLTAKSILVNEEYPIVTAAESRFEGVVTEGTVVAVNPGGLVMQLFGNACGFVPKSKISTEKVENHESLFFLGQVLKCAVVSTEPERNKMTLSLVIGGTSKPFGTKRKKEDVQNAKHQLDDEKAKDTNELDSEDTDMKVEDEEIKEEPVDSVPPTKADPGWEEDYNPWGNSEAVDQKPTEDELQASPGKQDKLKTHISKKEKKALDQLEAEEIAQAEQRVLDGEEAEPETVEEFDRLVLSSPNSSLCWIKYMAFHFERKDFDKARGVVARALEKINFREEDERLNIYMAWLNLENDCGSQKNVDDVLAKALKYSDQFKVYSKAAHMFSSCGKADQAEKLYKMLVRKFSKEPEVWMKLGQFYYTTGNFKEGRFTLQRSLQNLEAKHHVDVSCKFGQLEFKHGEVEEAKEAFQKILDNYPRRTNIWNVYVDQLVKRGEMESARGVLESAITLNLQPKRMKVLFQKFIDFETAHGSQKDVDRVRNKAREYVESKVVLAD